MISCLRNCGSRKVGYLWQIACIGLFFAPAFSAYAQEIAVTAQGQPQSASQSPAQGTLSPLDHSVYTPVASAPLGQADQAATAELKASIAACIGTQAWGGFQGTGTITYAGDANRYTITLSNLGSNKFRLDTTTPTGVESIRISGPVGRIQTEAGTITAIDPDTATMGIFPFEIVTKAALPSKTNSLIDHGSALTGGQSFHRITLELPSSLRDPVVKTWKALPIDLYFDPTTHLLAKSVNHILIPGGRLVPFLSIITYSDYRLVGTSVIPFHYVETIDGQPYRTVQLSSVQTNPSLPQDFFHFERSN